MDRALRYDSASGEPPAFQELRELLRYRDLLRVLISNINKTRYKRSALGVVWTLLNPLLNMLVLSIVFSQLLRFAIHDYAVYVLTNLIAWNFFSQTTTYAMSTLVWGGTLLKRVYVPRSVFTVAAIGNGLVNLGFAFVPLFIIIVVIGHPLHATWWFVPIAVLLLAMFSMGVALLMSILAVFFVDVVEMYGVVLQVVFYLTPIIYPQEILPPTILKYMVFNPFSSLIAVFRMPIFEGRLPDAATLSVAAASAAVALAAGWLVFTSKADGIAYKV